MSAHPSRSIVLKPEGLSPSRDDLEVVGAFNPGVAEANGDVLLLVRVAERPRELQSGFVALPRWDGGDVVVDWLPADDVESLDARVVRVRHSGRVRLTFTSHLRLVNCGSGRHVESVAPEPIKPQGSLEEFGIEDPRVTRIADRFFATYVAVSRHGAATALASTVDFHTFRRHGMIFHPENKDVVLFPELIRGLYCALHRPNGATPFTAPEMWIAWSHDLEHWGRHEPIVLAEGRPWASGRVGAGAPPVRVDDGWLILFHGNQRPQARGQVGQYVAAAMLLDAEHPSRIIAQSAEALFTPSEAFERTGFVTDVVFPTGTVRRGDTLLVYYGASDQYVGLVELSISEILKSLVAAR